MRFRVLDGKLVEIVSERRMLELFGEALSCAKDFDGVLYASSSEYQRKKEQLSRIEPKERLTPKRIAEDIYRDMLRIPEYSFNTLWKELLLRNIEN